MPPMHRDLVTPPNDTGGDRRANGFLGLTGRAAPVDPTNLSRFAHGDPGGSADLTKLASQVAPPNDSRFRDGDKGLTPGMEFPASPGKGAVPVNPFLASGGLASAARRGRQRNCLPRARQVGEYRPMMTGQSIPLDHPDRAPLAWPSAAARHGTFRGYEQSPALMSATQTGAEPRVEPAPATTER